jgi:MFS family permease
MRGMNHGPGSRLPRTVWMLGAVSLLMDVSSEMIHSLLPVFLVSTLGASALGLGLIEGAAEFTALAVRVVSGAWSDRIGRRKPLALLGYGLAALSKPLFALAPGTSAVFTARLLDRAGKGLRGAPRDALIADVTAPAQRGAAFGLRQALDTVGAFVGPLLALALMWLWHDAVRAVFWVAVVPATCAVALLQLGVAEAPRAPGPVRPPPPRNWLRMTPDYWRVVRLAGVCSLARCSDAFLVLRASELGLPLTVTPLVLIGLNLVYALLAYPLGRLGDRVARPTLLGFGMLALVAADLLLSQASGPVLFVAGLGLWGLHLAATQGLLSAMVADAAPPQLRGWGFGVMNLACGLALFLASALTGTLWDLAGAPRAYQAGAVLALAGALLALCTRRSDAAA